MPGIAIEDFILTDEKYNQGVTLDEYNGVLSLVSCRKTDKGMVFMQWCYPQTRENDTNIPADKSLPWKITLGDRFSAIGVLRELLHRLGDDPPSPENDMTENPWDDEDDIPF